MTDKTELEVTLADMDAAAKASGFDTWADAVYWSNLAKQSAVQNLAEAFAHHRISTRTPDPTPVAWLYQGLECGYRVKSSRQSMTYMRAETETPLYAHPPTTTPVDDRGGAVCEQQAVEVPRGVIAFLNGRSPLKGVWFGDKHPTERGAFWWRKYLPTLGDEA